jgi:hypothetical protein
MIARNRKLVEMGLVQVARAIAEGKVKMTVSDLDRLIRLEEYLREGPGGPGGTELIVTWTECDRSDADGETENGSEED